MKVHEALKRASSFLEAHGREPYAAEILLRHHLGVSRTSLLQMMQEELPQDVVEKLENDVQAHATGVPVQHLTGEEQFYGRSFHVTSDVLIPRPETEELVELVLASIDADFPGKEKLRVVDVGTGSGAIAVTLALENPRLSVSAIDLSEEALRVARRNAVRLGAKVDFYHGDLLTPFIAEGLKADVIVSNPPYIPETDASELDDLVREHEPHLALFGGADGLAAYRKLVEQLPHVLAARGFIAFEVGVGQSREVASMIQGKFPGSASVSIKKDINGKERMVSAVVMS